MHAQSAKSAHGLAIFLTIPESKLQGFRTISTGSIFNLKAREITLRSDIVPDASMKQLFVFEHDASRTELLIRILYWILIGIVAWVYGIIAFLCLFVQWFHVLILGCRNESLSNIAKGYLEYLVHVMGYMYIMTDKRPDVLPVTVKILEES